MVAYRFCRTDDIRLLVEAHNAAVLPHEPGAQELTVDQFKQWIRDLDLWCSSCMVANEGQQLIGVLIGNKRDDQTLIHRIGIHPDFMRQGHGQHMLTSLSQKLAILGPPRIVAEIPEEMKDVAAFFESCGFRKERALTDYAADQSRNESDRRLLQMIEPVTVDQLDQLDLLPAEAEPTAWSRARKTLLNCKRELQGMAVVSEQIEAFALSRESDSTRELVHFGCAATEQGSLLLALLIQHLRTQSNLIVPKQTDASAGLIERCGLRPIRRHSLYSATARSRH